MPKAVGDSSFVTAERDGHVDAMLLSGFDDPRLKEERWTRLLEQGNTNAINLTWVWQKTWWDFFGKGRLLLIAAERGGIPVAVAPLFTSGEMIFNVCPENHLDFIGDVRDPLVLEAILKRAASEVEGLIGFKFYFIPDTSSTEQQLTAAAARMGFQLCEENSLGCPFMDLGSNPDHAQKCIQKESLRRHERYFVRAGGLEIRHFTDGEQIMPHLDEFFEQHVTRRAQTPFPSLFTDPLQREYYRELTRRVGPYGWLRFTRIDWQGRVIAFHFGLSYRGRYLWGIPSFDVSLARHSPGELLLRQVLMAAISEQARTFDFGIGDEAYKMRFATGTVQLRTFGMYPQQNH